jgi:hypothetical protein
MRVALARSVALSACLREALASGNVPDLSCVDAADTRFRAAFEHIEAKGGCSATGDAGRVARLVDQCAVQLAQTLSPVCLSAGSPCGDGGLAPCCAGLACVTSVGEAPHCR